jgi:hypothetical protein
MYTKFVPNLNLQDILWKRIQKESVVMFTNKSSHFTKQVTSLLEGKQVNPTVIELDTLESGTEIARELEHMTG